MPEHAIDDAVVSNWRLFNSSGWKDQPRTPMTQRIERLGPMDAGFIAVDAIVANYDAKNDLVATTGKVAVRRDSIEAVLPCIEAWYRERGAASKIIYRTIREEGEGSGPVAAWFYSTNRPEDIARLLGAEFVGGEKGGGNG